MTSSPIRIADINRDGLNDILSASGTAITVMYQSPAHTFTTSLYPFVIRGGGAGGVFSVGFAVGDVTGDGYPDAVVTADDTNLKVLPNIP